MPGIKRSRLNGSSNPHTLLIYTDGSKMPNNKAGYGVVGIYLGKRVYSKSILLGRKLSSYDAEMHALAHGEKFASEFVPNHPTISEVHMFSDCSSALKTIMDASPHASQFASVLFRLKTLKLLKSHPNVRIRVKWTPGHKGVKGLDLADSNARKGARKQTIPIVDHISKSHHKERMKTILKRKWRSQYENEELDPSSGFYLAKQTLRVNPKPDNLFKTIPIELSGRLTQVLTGHAYTGEYYQRMNIPDKEHEIYCDCDNEMPTLHS